MSPPSDRHSPRTAAELAAAVRVGLPDGERQRAAQPGETGRSARSRQHLLTRLRVSAYADDMETTHQIAEGAASNDPDVGLRAVAALRVLTEQLEILQVDNARALGWSWEKIAGRLGVTKQTVHRKHGRRSGRR